MRTADRKIFPALLDQFERRLLTKLASDTRCSRSAVIRHLIIKEVAQQQLSVGRHEPSEKATARHER